MSRTFRVVQDEGAAYPQEGLPIDIDDGEYVITSVERDLDGPYRISAYGDVPLMVTPTIFIVTARPATVGEIEMWAADEKDKWDRITELNKPWWRKLLRLPA